jgi:hypothetical protein
VKIQFKYLVPFVVLGLLILPLEPAKKKITIYRYGYLNKQGKVVIPATFAFAKAFHKGRASAQRAASGKWGYIDKTGTYVVYPKFDQAPDHLEDGLNPVMIGGKWGYCDKAGQMIIAPQFDIAHPFREGLASVKHGEMWSFINEKGWYVVLGIKPRLGKIPQGSRWEWEIKNVGDLSEGLAAIKVALLIVEGGKYIDPLPVNRRDLQRRPQKVGIGV